MPSHGCPAGLEQPNRVEHDFTSLSRDVIVSQSLGPHPTRLSNVGCWPELRCPPPSAQRAGIINQDVVVADAPPLNGASSGEQDSLENPDDLDGFHVESGLLLELAPQRLGESLSHLDQAARQRPPTLEGLLAATDQKHATAIDHDSADPDSRIIGKLSPGPHQRRARRHGLRGDLLAASQAGCRCRPVAPRQTLTHWRPARRPRKASSPLGELARPGRVRWTRAQWLPPPARPRWD